MYIAIIDSGKEIPLDELTEEGLRVAAQLLQLKREEVLDELEELVGEP